jgi:hypothetical protein
MESVDSFIIGFGYGTAHKRELTAQEIATTFPDLDGDRFAQGMLDGIKGDRFRLDFLQMLGARYRERLTK